MVISYVKRTVSRKTERSKLWWKDENSSTNSRSFKELLINKRLEISSSLGYKLTNKKRTSYFYHAKFPHFLKELEVMTVQFLCEDCIFFLSRIFAITICVKQLQVCFPLLCCIFSISLYSLSLFWHSHVCAGLKLVKPVFWSTIPWDIRLYSFLALFVLFWGKLNNKER